MQNLAITIYGSSSATLAPVFYDAARQTGALIARAGFDLVSGGGRAGLMGAAIDGALAAGGKAIGILPGFMIDRGWDHPGLSVTIPTPDMHTRKAVMASYAAGVIALPGGIGTLDELMEIITWRQLGLWDGPVVILDTDGYYTPLLEMLAVAGERGFMRPTASGKELWAVASTPAEAVEFIKMELEDDGF